MRRIRSQVPHLTRQLAGERRYFHATPEQASEEQLRAARRAFEIQESAWPLFSPWETHTSDEYHQAAQILERAAEAWSAIPGRSHEESSARRAASRCREKAGA